MGEAKCTLCSAKDRVSTSVFASEKTSTFPSTKNCCRALTAKAMFRSWNSTSANRLPSSSESRRRSNTSPKFAQSSLRPSSVASSVRPAMCTVRKRLSSSASLKRLKYSACTPCGSEGCGASSSGGRSCCSRVSQTCFIMALQPGSITLTSHVTPRIGVPLSLKPSVTPAEVLKSICAKYSEARPGKERKSTRSTTSHLPNVSRSTASETCGLRCLTKSVFFVQKAMASETGGRRRPEQTRPPPH
mmetsp:Transcript_78190/g.247072  ORF Transcript_78190/g.247072 Transcript_78190/m.247072 type:complete len:245 (+) Transcript_78190:108-842(+)